MNNPFNNFTLSAQATQYNTNSLVSHYYSETFMNTILHQEEQLRLSTNPFGTDSLFAIPCDAYKPLTKNPRHVKPKNSNQAYDIFNNIPVVKSDEV